MFIFIFYLKHKFLYFNFSIFSYSLYYNAYIYSFPLSLIVTFMRIPYPFYGVVLKSPRDTFHFYCIIFILIFLFSYLGFLVSHSFHSYYINSENDDNFVLKDEVVHFLNGKIIFSSNRPKFYGFNGVLIVSEDDKKDKSFSYQSNLSCSSKIDLIDNNFLEQKIYNNFVDFLFRDLKILNNFLFSLNYLNLIFNILGISLLLFAFSYVFNLNMVNEFLSKNDYYAANYFAYIAYVATKDDNFVALLNLTLKFINENRNFEKEKMQLISEEKQKNFLYLNTEKFKLAYYGFSNLHKLLPSDNEILNYKNKSLEKLRKKYLFFDEIEKYFEYYGINDVFLLQPDSNGFYDYIYMQKVVTLNNYSKIIKNFELIRFNNTGNVILHIKIPFATLRGNSVYQNVLNKDDEQSEITLTKVFVSMDSFDTNVLEVVKINENVENLALFSNFTEVGFFLKIQSLSSAFNKVAILNLKLINIFSLSLVLLISPILLVLMGAFFISLFSKIGFNFNSKAMIFLVSLMIAIFSGIICLFVNYFLIVFTSLLIYAFNSVHISLAILSSLLFFLIFKVIVVNYREMRI